MLAKTFIILFALSTSMGDDNPYQLCSDAPPNVCGLHAKCLDKNNPEHDQFARYTGAYCRCNSNAFGRPPNCEPKILNNIRCNDDEFLDNIDQKCKKGCSSDDSCKSNEYCNIFGHSCTSGCRQGSCKFSEYCDLRERVCKIGCENDDNCESGEYCNVFSKKCEKGCRGIDDCQSDEYCDPFNRKCSKGCNNDKHCKSDEICVRITKNCQKGCRSDNECESGQYCDQIERKCKVGCSTTLQNCPNKQVCDYKTNECREGCLNHSDCGSDEYCNSDIQECQDICMKNPCGPNSKCSVINHSAYCSCADGYIILKGVGCVKEQDDGKNCEYFCSDNAECDFKDDKVYCYCPQQNSFHLNNPFVNCIVSSSSSSTYSGVKPTTSTNIGVQTIMCLG